MSLKCDWLVLCERVIEDTQTGNLSLVNCLDQVMAWSVPSTLPGFGFAARFSGEGSARTGDVRYEFRFVRCGEEGPEMLVVATDGELRPEEGTLKVFFNFAMLRLFREEVVQFRIDWRRPKQRWNRGPQVPLRIVLYAQETREGMAKEVARLQREMATSGKP